MRSNQRKYNHLILKNYVYLSLFESKYAIYNGERIASSVEKALEILQYIFMRDITEEEYSSFLRETFLVGSAVAKKSAEFSNQTINDAELIKQTFKDAQENEKNKNYINSIPKYERILVLLTNAITQNEIQKNLQLVDDKTTSVAMQPFQREYDTLFQCITLNDDVYKAIDTIEQTKFPDSDSCVLTRDTAIHEIHQGFTHLTRHVNSAYSNGQELERFKSHIRRASLDLLKLSLESIRNYFIKVDNIESLHEMSLAFSDIKNKEVSNVVSLGMASFQQKYTYLIKKYIKDIS